MEFYDFLAYMSEHTSEIKYDTANMLKNEWNPRITLTREDIALITKISQQNCLAVLRQYHDWISTLQ